MMRKANGVGETAMIKQPDSAALRRWAMECAALADDPRNSGEERERFLKIRAGLLDMAETQDWLDGEPRKQPPAQPVSGLGENVPGTTDAIWS
jgi:hypothetical protein